MNENNKTDKALLTFVNQPKEIIPEVVIADIQLEFILKGLGMLPSDADGYLLKLIERLIQKSFQLIEPKAGFAIYDKLQFNLEKHEITVFETVFCTGRTVTSLLKKSEGLVVFACTCGNSIENYSKELMKQGYSLEGLIVDLIGSEITESIAEYLHNYIESETHKFGMNVSNRYSPGYCNWNVSEQQKLFPLLKRKDCGIQLTPSSLMLPIKSVSGIFGVGTSIKRIRYKCSFCEDEKCILRGK